MDGSWSCRPVVLVFVDPPFLRRFIIFRKTVLYNCHYYKFKFYI